MTDQLKRRIEVSLMRTVNIGNYESVRGGVMLSQNITDKADENAVYISLWETAEKQLDDYLSQYELNEDKPEPEQPLEEEVEGEIPEEEPPEEEVTVSILEEEEVPEEDAELDITEEEINKMTKSELINLCKTTEGMEDIDLTLNVRPLRAIIIDLIFEEEGEEGEEDAEKDEEGVEPNLDETGGEWDQDDWQDQE